MQTPNANKPGKSDDSVWQLLAEYPISEFLSDHNKGNQQNDGLLFQKMRELGIPLEYLENINITLARFANVVQEDRHLERPGLTGQIRIFCQKTMIADANSVNFSRPFNANPAKQNAQAIYHSGSKGNEGWGYYVIEKSRIFAHTSYKESCRIIELFLFKEGK